MSHQFRIRIDFSSGKVIQTTRANYQIASDAETALSQFKADSWAAAKKQGINLDDWGVISSIQAIQIEVQPDVPVQGIFMGTPKPRERKQKQPANGVLVTEADRQLWKRQGFKSAEDRALYLKTAREALAAEQEQKAAALAAEIDQRLEQEQEAGAFGTTEE